MPATILSRKPVWHFLQYHQRYLLQYNTIVTHASTPSTLSILTCRSRQSCHPWQHATHGTHARASPRLAHNPCYPGSHISQASTPLMIARHPRWHLTHATNVSNVQLAIFQTQFLQQIFKESVLNLFLKIFFGVISNDKV